jgi:hypothetical protein
VSWGRGVGCIHDARAVVGKTSITHQCTLNPAPNQDLYQDQGAGI